MSLNPNNKETKKFYNDLMNLKKNFTFFEKNTRFDVDKLLKRKNIKKYFDKKIQSEIKNNDKILDFGCGPGTFSLKLSNMTRSQVHSVDISDKFIDECERQIKIKDKKNIFTNKNDGSKLKYEDNYFDKILLIDVIHHLEDIHGTLKELKRVLKQNGKIIVYEPNILNPLMLLMHLIDKNERGLLKVGRKKKYKDIFEQNNLKIENFEFNGIIIGPNSKFLELISDSINYNNTTYNLFGWLNPKVYFTVKKN